MRDLAVCYRIYPGLSKNAAFLGLDKLKMSQMCLDSFRRACDGLRVKIWVLLDKCPPEYEALFHATFSEDELEIISLNGEGNYATFSRQIDILTQQTEAEYVVFVEDDYFFLPGALGKMLDFMKDNPEVDFVTPYDNPDCYFAPNQPARQWLKPYGDRYWHTTVSTCLTFLTSRSNLLRTHSTFRSFSRGNWDCALWQSLTQKCELANLRLQWRSPFNIMRWIKTWRWGLRTILFGRRYRLWAPMPTLATHLEASYLSPLIDWPAIFACRQQESDVSK
jgi:hypothetical protein